VENLQLESQLKEVYGKKTKFTLKLSTEDNRVRVSHDDKYLDTGYSNYTVDLCKSESCMIASELSDEEAKLVALKCIQERGMASLVEKFLFSSSFVIVREPLKGNHDR